MEPIHGLPYYIDENGDVWYSKNGDILNGLRKVNQITKRGKKSKAPFWVYPIQSGGETIKIPVSRLLAGYFADLFSLELFKIVYGLKKPWLFPRRFRIHRIDMNKPYSLKNMKVVIR